MQSRTKKLLALAALCLLMAALAWNMNWSAYVQGWFGVHFKLISGSLLGYATDRHFLCNDISNLPPESKPLAALQRALMVAAFALGAATGV